MLIEFSIENFRSISSRQTLSMVAAPRLKKKANTIDAGIRGETFPALLKAAAIYGPNASGKSTIVKALRVFTQLVQRQPSANKSQLPVSAFAFDPLLRDLPSKFEIHFVESKTRYSLKLALTSDRIYEEELTVYSKAKPQLLYSRIFSDGHETYQFGDALEGGEQVHDAWRKLTSPQALFLAQAVANSNEELNQLRRPLNWLLKLMIEDSGMGNSTDLAQRLIAIVPEFGVEIANLLSDVDIPIQSIRARLKEDLARKQDTPIELMADMPESIKDKFKTVFSASEVSTTLTHKTSIGEWELDFEDESEGTKNLIGFALPWFVFRQEDNSLRRNVLIVDEIDSSLHPKLVEALIRRHFTSNLDCQLIFTTHDTHLMDTKILRRDQIWLTERDDSGATQLRSIHDFAGREGEDIEKRYYEGRYRGLPFIKEL